MPQGQGNYIIISAIATCVGCGTKNDINYVINRLFVCDACNVIIEKILRDGYDATKITTKKLEI